MPQRSPRGGDDDLGNSGTGDHTEDDKKYDEKPLPEDTYGAAIFAFIYDAREFLSGHDHDSKPCWLNMYRLTYVLVVLGVNYVFQFLMLFWIFDFVVQPSVHSVQKYYARYHGEFFSDEGDFQRDTWDDTNGYWDQKFKKHLCHMVFPKFTFLSFVLMLWVMHMVIEFRRSAELLADLCKLPPCPNSHPELMIEGTGGGFDETEADDDTLYVMALTPCVRCTVICLIIVPKFIIGSALTALGLIWLSATVSFSELILNSLALEFVINIDDNLYKALLPHKYRLDIQNVKMKVPHPHQTLEEQTEDDWRSWKTSTFFMLFIPCLVYSYLKYFQYLPVIGVIPDFMEDISTACEPFLIAHKTRLCASGLSSEECFEYGNQNPFLPG